MPSHPAQVTGSKSSDSNVACLDSTLPYHIVGYASPLTGTCEVHKHRIATEKGKRPPRPERRACADSQGEYDGLR